MINPNSPPSKPALQLWSILNLLEINIDETLEMVASLGFSSVELAGFGNHRPKVLAKALEKWGLEVIGIHDGPVRLLNKSVPEITVQRMMEYCDIFSTNTVVVTSLPEGLDLENGFLRQRWTSDLFHRLNEIAYRLDSSSLRLSYHGYAHDFKRQPKSHLAPIYSQFSEKIECKNVGLQLDTYFASIEGVSLEGILKSASNIHSFHLMEHDAEFIPKPFGEGGTNWLQFVTAALERFPDSSWILEPFAPHFCQDLDSAKNLISTNQSAWLNSLALNI
jgi:sugar phosphate isomerase/epimerase